MREESLHVQMLGGFGLQLGDKPLPSMPPQSASLLAYLIVNRDREHTRDLLAGRFWSDLSDDLARRRLSQALWQINSRTKHDVELLVATTNTVRFKPDLDVVVDAEIFERRLDHYERLRRSSRHDARALDLGSIVDSYRGELLAGYYDEWLRDEREKLHSRYRAALGQLVQLRSNEGDYEAALRYALALVNEEQFDEDAQREVLRLYALNGQPSAAERHYQRLVDDLDKQLGVAPSAETAHLMRSILDDAANPPVGFAEIEREGNEFVGRRAERSTVLNRVIELTSSGKGGVVLIEGEPGIGKTRLAEELAKGAEWRGAQVLVGNHVETSVLNPYEGLKRALAPATSGLRLERLRDSVDPLWVRQASGVLDGLSSLFDSKEGPRLRPAEEPWRTAEALARVILAQGRPKPTVLILEDIHNCDDDTMAVLTQLGDRLIDSQVLVCLTYRLRSARSKAPIWQGLSQLEAEPGSSRVVVPPLQPDEVRELITAELGPGRMSVGMMEQVVKSTDGNPYMLLELLRSPIDLLDEGEPAEWGGPVGGLDELGGGGFNRIEDQLLPKLSTLIEQRLETVPEHVRLVLEAAATIGTAATPDVVARAAGVDHVSAVDGLQQAVDLGFLVETDRGCDFDQSQTRRVVYETLSIERRSVLHGRVVDALTLAGQRPGAGQLAHHAWLAGQWQRAHQYHSLAAEAALKINAFQTSAEHFNKADHAALAAGIDDRIRIEDLFEHEAVLDVLGRREEQADLLDRIGSVDEIAIHLGIRLQSRQAALLLQTDGAAEAAEVAQRAADEAQANQINAGELLTIVGSALYRTGRLSSSIEPLEEAIGEFRSGGMSAVQAQLMLGRAYADLHEFDAAHRFLEEAYNEAKAADDPRSQVEALGHMAILWDIQSIVPRVEQAFLEAITLAKEIGFRQGEGFNSINLAVFYMVRGRGGRALGLLDQAARIFASLQDRRAQAYVQVNRAWVLHWFVGDDTSAEREATAAAVQFREIGDMRTEAVCLNVIAGVDRRAGRRRRAKQRLQYAIDQAVKAEDRRTEVQLHLSLALVGLQLDRVDDALDRLASARSLTRAHDLDEFLAVLAAVEAMARAELGQREAVDQLTETTIRSNHPGAELAHLAAWWCAKALIACDRHDDAAEQVALAHELLSSNLDGLSETMLQQAWSDVPEHAEILEAREHYFLDHETLEVPAAIAPTGRSLGDDDYVSVTVTRSHPNDWSVDDHIERRWLRLQRIAAEAVEQGGVARQSDLASVLRVSERTIKRDLAQLREQGHDVVTRRSAGEIS